jgi:hypothetical protein
MERANPAKLNLTNSFHTGQNPTGCIVIEEKTPTGATTSRKLSESRQIGVYGRGFLAEGAVTSLTKVRTIPAYETQ